jgi:hypothetical protein
MILLWFCSYIYIYVHGIRDSDCYPLCRPLCALGLDAYMYRRVKLKWNKA